MSRFSEFLHEKRIATGLTLRKFCEETVPNQKPSVHQVDEGNGSLLFSLFCRQKRAQREVENHIWRHYSAAINAVKAGKLDEALSHCVTWNPDRDNQMREVNIGGSYKEKIGWGPGQTQTMTDAEMQAAYDEVHTEEKTMDEKVLHPAVLQVLKYFQYQHLPLALQKVSWPFHDLAWKMAMELPESPEVTVGLRKLLEAKDAMVRAALP